MLKDDENVLLNDENQTTMILAIYKKKRSNIVKYELLAYIQFFFSKVSFHLSDHVTNIYSIIQHHF